MNILRLLSIFLIMGVPLNNRAQSLFEKSTAESKENIVIGGFIRGLQYITTGDQDKILFPSSISDLGLKLNAGNGLTYRAYSDIRYRFGFLNGNTIGEFRVPEAWVSVYSAKAGLKVGQQVLKWGNAEFINRMDAFNPRNDLVRSPDIEDRNLGNLLAVIDFYPVENVNLQLVGTPAWRSSSMYTDYINLEDGIKFTNNNLPGTNKLSYGAKLTLLARGFETKLYWFDGYYHMPGISLDSLFLPVSQEDEFGISIRKTPYRRKIAGCDLSFILGKLILKNGISYSSSPLNRQIKDYVPLPQLDWFGNIELSPGNFTIIAEYSGSKILEYTALLTEAILPGSGEFNLLPGMTAGQIKEYTAQLIASFNRLMNYQVHEYYHSAGAIISYANRAMTLKSELRILYYFTTREIMLQPVISYNVYDNVIFRIGLEYWKGENNSIFQLIHKRLNGINASIQVNF